MKITKKMVVVLASMFLITLAAIFFISQNQTNSVAVQHHRKSLTAQAMNELPLPLANARVDPTVLPAIPSMPAAVTPTIEMANFPDLDRMPLDNEPLSLVPANEAIATNYKDWHGSPAVDKELYAKAPPLFNQTGKIELVPLDVNSEQRRINFY